MPVPGRLASIIAGKHGRKELRGRIRVKKCQYLGGWLPSSLANMGGRNCVAGLGLRNAIPGRLASIFAAKHGRKELRGRIRVKKCHTLSED
jgi:hypothetical protein